MNPHLIARLFPNASKSLIAANSDDYGTGLIAENSRKIAKLERSVKDESLAADTDKESDPEKRHVRIVSVRKRLIDPDNISVKYLIDALRYANVLHDDAAKDITLEVSQRKCDAGEIEHTLVEIWKRTS